MARGRTALQALGEAEAADEAEDAAAEMEKEQRRQKDSRKKKPKRIPYAHAKNHKRESRPQ